MDDVAEHDFDSARAYLSIEYSADNVRKLVNKLHHASMTERRANDILRACKCAPLPIYDPGVMHNLLKVVRGESMSPILVVNGDIADGYHRVSLVYALDPFGLVPLRII